MGASQSQADLSRKGKTFYSSVQNHQKEIKNAKNSFKAMINLFSQDNQIQEKEEIKDKRKSIGEQIKIAKNPQKIKVKPIDIERTTRSPK